MAFKLRSQSPLTQGKPTYEKITAPYYSVIIDAEDAIDKFLGKPMDKAQARRERFNARTNGNNVTSDKINHASAGMYTRKAIANKLGGGVLGNAVGVIGSNVLGVGHELSSFNSDNGYWNGIVEAGKDIVNNAIGSVSNEKNVDKRVQKYGTSGMSDAEEKARLKYIAEEKKRKSPAQQKKSPLQKQKLSPKAAKAKAKRDLAYAKTDDRTAKKAHSQRMHRKNPNNKGMDYDHEDGRFESVKQNRGNEGEGTKKESGKKYKIK
jgi:hypothetical protein